MSTQPNADVMVLQNLGEQISERIKRAILKGELAGGDRLVESELAERYGTSRGPVRDALTLLERRGLVVSRARRWTSVKKMTRDDVDEVYGLRVALESVAVSQLARSKDRAIAVAELEQRQVDLAAAHLTGDRLKIGEADMAFHRSIVVGSGHRRLADAWERLSDETLLLMVELSSIDSVVQAPGGDHRSLVDAITDGDAEAACAALEHHLMGAASAIIAGIEPGLTDYDGAVPSFAVRSRAATSAYSEPDRA